MKIYVFMAAFISVFTVRADVISVHCPLGCPTSPSGNDLIFGHVYALSNNPQTKFADWVAYEVDVTNFGPSPGRSWAADPFLDAPETLEEGDYKKAHSKLSVDKGHQAPLASFAGSKYWSELNYLSNITPQKSDLNQGAWVDLEVAVRDAVAFRDSLFVITGPIYQNSFEKLPGADESHVVPTAYFKVIYDLNGRAAAFLFSQSTGRNAFYCDHQKGIQKIDSQITTSLPNLSESPDILKRLGC